MVRLLDLQPIEHNCRDSRGEGHQGKEDQKKKNAVVVVFAPLEPAVPEIPVSPL